MFPALISILQTAEFQTRKEAALPLQIQPLEGQLSRTSKYYLGSVLQIKGNQVILFIHPQYISQKKRLVFLITKKLTSRL